MSRDYWTNAQGQEICHLCDEPVERADSDTMYGLSGAPVHGKCGDAAMDRGKALRVGEGRAPRDSTASKEVPVKVDGKEVGTAKVTLDEEGLRAAAHITDPAIAEAVASPLFDFSIAKKGEQ